MICLYDCFVLEVVLSKPYTFSAEVFSWSIILWQVIKHVSWRVV